MRAKRQVPREELLFPDVDVKEVLKDREAVRRELVETQKKLQKREDQVVQLDWHGKTWSATALNLEAERDEWRKCAGMLAEAHYSHVDVLKVHALKLYEKLRLKQRSK